MIVVSDTSPITNLSVIGQLDLLRQLYELITYEPLSPPQAEGSQQKSSFESYQLGVVQSAELSPVKE